MDKDGSPSDAPRVEVAAGLGTANDFAPSRRFREDRREASKLATAGRRQKQYSWRARRSETN